MQIGNVHEKKFFISLSIISTIILGGCTEEIREHRAQARERTYLQQQLLEQQREATRLKIAKEQIAANERIKKAQAIQQRIADIEKARLYRLISIIGIVATFLGSLWISLLIFRERMFSHKMELIKAAMPFMDEADRVRAIRSLASRDEIKNIE